MVALFPLPLFCDTFTTGCRGPRDYVRRLAADALQSLNWFGSLRYCTRARGGRASRSGKPDPLHGQVTARALDLSAAWVFRRQEAQESPDAPCHTSEAALLRLLKERALRWVRGSQQPRALQSAPDIDA